MSTSTFLQLCKDTQAACEISGTPISSVENQKGILADIVTWVANADVAVQREASNWDFLYKTDFLVNTVIGVANYNRPTDYGVWDNKTFFLDYGTANNQKLRSLDYRTYYNVYGNTTQVPEQPINYVRVPNDNLILYPTPDAAYALSANYWTTPVRMVLNTDTSVIPENFIRCIIARAKMYFAISEESDPVYQEAQKEFGEVLSELKSDQLPGWEGYRISDDVQMTVSTDGFTGDGGGDFNGEFY
jgi:hypothetical protein